jgi:aminoglycoside phosphotransferase (APT) family kinase protein
VTIDASVIGTMLDRLRAVDGFEQAQLAGDARPITGGFWATLLLVPLSGARAPAVVLRLMPDGPMAEKETIFQQQAARQGLPVPEVFVAGDGNAGLGLPFLVMARAAGAPPLAGLDGIAALRRLPSAARALPALLGSVMAELHRLDPQPFLDAPRALSAAIDIPGALDHLTVSAARLERADLTQAAAWLAGHRPAAAAPVVCHGDLHPFNLLVSDNDHWTLLDWTAAVIAEPAYDLAFTTLLLRHPPLAAPGPLQPVIGAAGRYAARRFQASYQASGQALPGQPRLEWHTAMHALRILIEVEGWRHEAVPGQHAGHPWLAIGPPAAEALQRTTGTRVSWRPSHTDRSPRPIPRS